MSILIKSVPLVTNSDGDASATVRAGGLRLLAIRFEIGTLDEPDLSITEEPDGPTILAVTGVAADKTYYPSVLASDADGADVAGAALPVPVYDRMEVVIANGGDTLTGRVRLLYER